MVSTWDMSFLFYLRENNLKCNHCYLELCYRRSKSKCLSSIIIIIILFSCIMINAFHIHFP